MAKRPLKLANTDMDDVTDTPAPVAAPIAPTASPFATTSSLPPAVVVAPETLAKTTAPNIPVATAKNTQPAPANRDEDRKEYFKSAKEFGETKGAGDTAFVRLARLAVEGGNKGVLTPKSKDAEQLYDAFSTARNKRAGKIVEDNAASKPAAQISKVRAFIRLGDKYKDEGEQVFETAKEVHAAIMASPELRERVKLGSTYAALCSIAVNQCKTDAAGVKLTPDQMRDLLLNPVEETKEKDGWDILNEACLKVQAAQKGRSPSPLSNGRDPVKHDHLQPIIDALRGVLADLDKDRLAAHDAEVEALKQKKIDAAKAKAEKERVAAEKKAAKDKEASIQAGLKSTPAAPETESEEAPEDEDNVDMGEGIEGLDGEFDEETE